MAQWVEPLRPLLKDRLSVDTHGDMARWIDALERLPAQQPVVPQLDGPVVRGGSGEDGLKSLLRQLHPWRKGPFELGGVHIDTEWRSDWKWDRLAPHLDDLTGRRVLDVGCGSGYHCWRLAGAGARLAIGIDPTLLYVMQFFACRHFIRDNRVWVLPLGVEDLPPELSGFDTVMSMGVLYHRRSPIDHLEQLRSLLRPGGQLLLETLVIEGDESSVLVPESRYARMRNVWFIPSAALLQRWLRRSRFGDVELVDINVTTIDEQRSTHWMEFQSLKDFLDPDDASLTVEGYPAPRRAIVTARRTD